MLSLLITFAGVVVNNKAYLEYVSGSFLWNWWSPDEALKDLQILQDIQCLNNIIAVTLLSGLFAKMLVYFGLARKKLNLDENAICSVIGFVVCLIIFILYIIGFGLSRYEPYSRPLNETVASKTALMVWKSNKAFC